MSDPYYQDLWKTNQKELRKVVQFDAKIRKTGPFKNPDDARWLIGHLFMNYVNVVNNLDKCYDQMAHPQKREVISRLLDMALGRLLEIKREIIRIEMEDYHYFDNILMELKITHQDMEVRVPRYYWRDREKARSHRRDLIKQAIEEVKLDEIKVELLEKVPEEEQEEVWEKYLADREAERKADEAARKKPTYIPPPPPIIIPPDQLPFQEAVLTIQRHERARQEREKIPIAKRNQMLKKTGIKPKKIPPDEASQSAAIIQQHWRRHWKRKMAARRLQKQMMLMGMLEPSWKDKTPFERVEEVLKIRRAVQDRNQDEYEKALVSIKERVTKLYSATMAEDIADHIRFWFESYFIKTEFLPNYPPADALIPTAVFYGVPKGISKEFVDKTFKHPHPPIKVPKSKLMIDLMGIKTIEGSELVVNEFWINPIQFLTCRRELDRLKKLGKKGKPKKPPKLTKQEKAELKKKEKAAELKRIQAEEAQGYQMKATNFIAPLNKADKDYKLFWENIDETNNREQRFISDIVKEDKCRELSAEVRREVDEMMRLELELLQDAWQLDKNPKWKKKKPKKPKKKKGKKGKKKKDPTGHRTNDDLFKELFKNGIIREYEEAYLKDYFGEPSYSAFEGRLRDEDPLPATGDVKEVILYYAILPLGSWRVHELSPVTRSLCLLGPENSGKEYLSRIICTETASVMFDLTPSNVVGKYPGKEGLKMLTHLVEKMSRVLQPSIIFIDGAEKPYYKKVPKLEKPTEPKRLKGIFKKLGKKIKPDEQVLLLGTCSYPWLCPPGKLMKTYDRFIYIPRPDYGTYFRLWQNLLIPYHSLDREFDFSCLAKVSTGYSMKLIMDLVKQVLNGEKIGRNRVNPYKPQDFMAELCKIDPTPDKMMDKCYKFILKTPMGKKKVAQLAYKQMLRKKNKK